MRSWCVAFLIFSSSLQPAHQVLPWSAAAVVAWINLLGPPASIFGNEVAVRLGRRRTILSLMILSAALSAVVGFTARLPWTVLLPILILYFVLILGDSGTLTAGLVAAADPAQRGAALAMHSFFGFGTGVLAPLIFGLVLDLAGGNGRVLAWGLAFATFAVAAALGGLLARARI
jgi:MFS family permease